MFWSLLIELRCLALVAAQGRGVTQGWCLILKSGNKSHKKRGKMVIFWNFLDLNSPRPTSGLPGPWESFNLKQPARLGELPLQQMAFSYKYSCRGRVSGVGKLRKEGKNAERRKKRIRKKQSKRCQIELWIVSYIISLASLVPYATVG